MLHGFLNPHLPLLLLPVNPKSTFSLLLLIRVQCKKPAPSPIQINKKPENIPQPYEKPKTPVIPKLVPPSPPPVKEVVEIVEPLKEKKMDSLTTPKQSSLVEQMKTFKRISLNEYNNESRKQIEVVDTSHQVTPKKQKMPIVFGNQKKIKFYV